MSEQKFSARDALALAAEAEKNRDAGTAFEQYLKVLAYFPNHTTATAKVKKLHKLLGGQMTLTQEAVNKVVEYLNAGDMRAVAEAAGRLSVIAPREPVLHNFRGIALARLGEPELAVRSYRTAIKLRPNYAEAMSNLGTVLTDLKKPDEALPLLNRAIALNPSLPEALNSKGLCLMMLGNGIKAVDAFNAAIKIFPKYLTAFNNKGLAFKEMREFETAIDTFKSGLQMDPKNVDILKNLGYTYSENGQEQLALDCLKKADEISPGNPEILMRLGSLYSQVGDLKNSIQSLKASIAANPDQAEAYRLLAGLKKFTAEDPDVQAFQAAFDRNQGLPEPEMHLGFALGKAYEDTGKYQQAFNYWNIGNRRRRDKIEYEVDTDILLTRKIRTFFSPGTFASYQGYQDQTESPIFIVGMMRSGTTLIEQILASHSQVYAAGEWGFINNYARNHRRFLDDAGLPDLEEFAKGYLASLPEQAGQAARFVDKLPINFLWVGYIKAMFPNARIINLRRDPRDVALSVYKNYFVSEGNQYAYDLTELGQFYMLYLEMMDHWRRVLPGAIYDIGYEAVVTDIRTEAENLLAYCGLAWEESVLNFQETERVVKTASLHQVRQKIHTGSVAGWRRFETEMAPFIDVMNKSGALDSFNRTGTEP